MDTEIHDVSIP